MSSFREKALQAAAGHEAARHFYEKGPVSTYFGCNVFSKETMQKYVGTDAYDAVLKAQKTGEKIQRSTADEIAAGMKAWAMERGVTHYTHLFQPLTGATAEKHEAFLSVKDGLAVESFTGSALVQQEPDASSFPNGGLRNTFEARGYSAWDPLSPAFILDGTLCLPSVFVSYTGEALDMKVPNLRSIHALDEAATSVARLFEPDVQHVRINVGLEQEYFLVDESLYNSRPDLQLCGRTVVGHTSAKDQQLSDHYFGAIPSRVASFMKDFETEAFKLGIPLQTRHNEVAPNQFECTPVFSEITTDDHNAESGREAPSQSAVPREALPGSERQRQALQLVSADRYRHQFAFSGQDAGKEPAFPCLLRRRGACGMPAPGPPDGICMLAEQLLSTWRQ